MYIYYALINALSAHTIHINLNTIFYAHVEHSPTDTSYIRYYMETHARARAHTNTHTHTHTRTHARTHALTHTHTHTMTIAAKLVAYPLRPAVPQEWKR